jgi:hypothetical protein
MFHKTQSAFIGPHNEPPSVAAMRVNNPDCSRVGVHGMALIRQLH